jgi:preprotein translocase subunit YajC
MRKQFFKLIVLILFPITVFAQDQELCEGDAVTTSSHLNGTVTQVFPDGMVRVRINGFKYLINSSELSKRISCLNDICSGDAVTTTTHAVGTVKQVFADGVALVYVNNFWLSSFDIGQLGLNRKCIDSDGNSCWQ